MALWERAEKDPEIKMRRYRCPDCGKYALHVKYESFAECANGCFIHDEKIIAGVLDSGDFDGHFSREELETDFI
jgi:hypothetical protein